MRTSVDRDKLEKETHGRAYWQRSHATHSHTFTTHTLKARGQTTLTLKWYNLTLSHGRAY